MFISNEDFHNWEPNVTRQQEKLLRSAGIAKQKGRTFREANVLILELIGQGKLSREVLSPASTKQIEFLNKHEIPVPHDITKEEASVLIGKKKATLDAEAAARNQTTPLSEKQFDFIRELGGFPSQNMTRAQAAEYIDFLRMNQTECSKCGELSGRLKVRCDYCGRFIKKQGLLRPPAEIYSLSFWEFVFSLFPS